MANDYERIRKITERRVARQAIKTVDDSTSGREQVLLDGMVEIVSILESKANPSDPMPLILKIARRAIVQHGNEVIICENPAPDHPMRVLRDLVDAVNKHHEVANCHGVDSDALENASELVKS